MDSSQKGSFDLFFFLSIYSCSYAFCSSGFGWRVWDWFTERDWMLLCRVTGVVVVVGHLFFVSLPLIPTSITGIIYPQNIYHSTTNKPQVLTSQFYKNGVRDQIFCLDQFLKDSEEQKTTLVVFRQTWAQDCYMLSSLWRYLQCVTFFDDFQSNTISPTTCHAFHLVLGIC